MSMLPQDENVPASRFSVHMAPADVWDLEKLRGVGARQWRVILGGVGLGVLGAALYISTAVPKYKAVVGILLDAPQVGAVADVSGAGKALSFETGGIDSQVELLKSTKIMLGVIKKLDLKNDPNFVKPPSLLARASGGLSNAVLSLFGGAEQPTAEEVARAENVVQNSLIKAIGSELEIKRIGRTYVVELQYTSPDPALAARIVNTFAEQYLVDQLEAKYDATSRAAVWLQDRIGELKGQSLVADTKVQKFRAENGLIAVDGRLVNEQQLTDANAQLSDARAKVAEAEAKAARIDAIKKLGNIDAAVNESLANPVIAALRTKFLDASKREAEISKKLGPTHVAAANLRSEMSEYERLLFDELGRIGESYRSDYQIAKSRLASLESNFNDMLAQTSANNQTLVTLRELERESSTYKTLYETFLQRYQSAIQQQSFPINDARVISAGSPPIEASWPKKGLVLTLGFVLGAMIGSALAFVREWADRVFRTGGQVQSELQLEFLGLLPKLAESSARPPMEGRQPGVLGKIAPTMQYSLTSPLSGFAETLRATKVAADIALRGKPTKIIGVVSVLPSEGKTTVSKNLASLISNLGAKTILIDCDLRNPGLSRNIAQDATDGLVELLGRVRTLDEVALVEPTSKLVIIPAVVHRKTNNSSELLSSREMSSFLEVLGRNFEYIILDLPPLGPVIDVRAAANLIDAFVFVTEWGKTPRALVRTTLEIEDEVRQKTLGVILNKVDQSRMSLYEGSEYRNYYYSKYSKYYTTG